jgi:L-ascorbate metabolism protein UlaG (beta-lactamase superfamily)
MLKRRIKPGISFEKLPKIDLILISHNHYDHCDIHFLKKITKRDHPKFVVPLGLDQQLKSYGILADIVALDWYDSWHLHSCKITLTPAKHWSRRHMFDTNKTLWGGFIIQDQAQSLYFMGDSGYDDHLFKKLGKDYGPFDISLISVGAYHPRWFMKYAHMNPFEACLVHNDVKSRLSIAMHHRCFPLADEGPLDPADDLNLSKKELNIPQDHFIILEEGSSISARKI